MKATLTLQGLYNVRPDLFDLFHLPTGIDKELLIENLLAESMGLEVLYASPDYLKRTIGMWSQKMLDPWTKLLKTTLYEYDPIYNYDRKEERTLTIAESERGTRALTGNVTESGSDTDNITYNITDTSDTTSQSTSHTTGSTTDSTTEGKTSEREKSAYNATDYQPLEKLTEDMDQNHTNDVSGQVTNQGTEQDTARKTGTEDHIKSISKATNTNDSETTNRTGDQSHKETIRAYGNIGVTTTQQMITQEREIDVYNIYDTIISDFIGHFCLLVY